MPKHPRFGGRTLARSQALQLLFQAEATGRMVVDVLAGDYALSDGPLDSFGEQLAVGADSMIHDLDAVMEMCSSNWGVSRMPSVDRNLLRLAIYEMLEVEEVDIAVTIDEFVELAKAYGTDESSRFVNGLLGHVATLIEEGEDVVALACGEQGSESPESVSSSPEAEGEVAEDASAEDVEISAVEGPEELEDAPATEEASSHQDAPADDDLPAWAREV